MRTAVVGSFFLCRCSPLLVDRRGFILGDKVVKVEIVCVAQARFVVVFNVRCLLDHSKQARLPGPSLEIRQSQDRRLMSWCCAYFNSRWWACSVGWRLLIERRKREVPISTGITLFVEVKIVRLNWSVRLLLRYCRRGLRCRQARAAPCRACPCRCF